MEKKIHILEPGMIFRNEDRQVVVLLEEKKSIDFVTFDFKKKVSGITTIKKKDLIEFINQFRYLPNDYNKTYKFSTGNRQDLEKMVKERLKEETSKNDATFDLDRLKGQTIPLKKNTIKDNVNSVYCFSVNKNNGTILVGQTKTHQDPKWIDFNKFCKFIKKSFLK